MTPLAVAVSERGLVEPSEPVLRADDEGFTRGRACFETIRVYAGKPFRFVEHAERLQRSARLLDVTPPELPELERLSRLALDHAGEPDAVLRLYWTPGPPGGDPLAVVIVQPLPEHLEGLRERGLALASLAVPRRQEPWLLPGSKSVSYAVNMAVEAEARRRGADDAVFVDETGIVLEGPTTNIWWREGDTLLTPSTDLGILAGVTRATVIDLAERVGLSVAEGEFPVERLRAAGEAFTSSSVREVMPVISLDGAPIPRGTAAEALQRELRESARA